MVREWVAGKTVWSPCYHGPHLSALSMGSSIVLYIFQWVHLTIGRYTSVRLLLILAYSCWRGQVRQNGWFDGDGAVGSSSTWLLKWRAASRWVRSSRSKISQNRRRLDDGAVDCNATYSPERIESFCWLACESNHHITMSSAQSSWRYLTAGSRQDARQSPTSSTQSERRYCRARSSQPR